MWVKLWDSLRDWRYKTNPKIMALWVHILLFAEWQGKERGVLVTSLRNLVEGTGLTYQEVRTALKKLSASGEVVVEVTQQATQQATQRAVFGIAQNITKITVCKYERYQGKQKPSNTVKANTDNTTSNTASNTPTFIYSEDNTDNAIAPAPARESVEEVVDRLYALYPSSTVRSGGKCSTGKCAKDKQRLTTLLKTHTEEQVKKVIERYVKEQNGQYLKNFSTFLNNFPEYTEEEPIQRKDPTAADVLGPEYVEWLKTQKGKEFNELFK